MVAHSEELAHIEVDWHRPLLGLPVVCRLCIEGIRGLRCGDIAEKRLQKRGTYIRTGGVPRNGLDVVGKRPIGPGSRLLEDDRCRADTPFLTAENVIGGGRQQEDGACAPDPATG